MKRIFNKIPYKRLTLVLTLCAIGLWGLLGTGTSLAWFVDTSEEVTNIFHFADFEVTVDHRTDSGVWESIDGRSDIFDREALYEPGYTQVVYLRVKNTGDREFKFQLAVSATESNTWTNVFGHPFWLHEHLKFGVVFADSEAEMDLSVATRELTTSIATTKLQNYSKDNMLLYPDEEKFIAIVVRMPEEVGNEANYRGDEVPTIKLGIIVKADQLKPSGS